MAMDFNGPALACLALGGLLSGCASHGELVTLREDVQKQLSATRVHLNERIDQAADQLEARKKALAEQQQHVIAELKAQLHAVNGLHATLKELQLAQDRQQKTLDELKQHVVSWKAVYAQAKEAQQQAETARAAAADVRGRLEALQRDRTHLEAVMKAVEEAVLRTLRSEQVELRDRLKALDRSVKDLEQIPIPTSTVATH